MDNSAGWGSYSLVNAYIWIWFGLVLGIGFFENPWTDALPEDPETKVIYITKVKNFMSDYILQNGKVGFVTMNKSESIDIDTQFEVLDKITKEGEKPMPSTMLYVVRNTVEISEEDRK